MVAPIRPIVPDASPVQQRVSADPLAEDEALGIARAFAASQLGYSGAEIERRIHEPQMLRDGGRTASCCVVPVTSRIGTPFLWIAVSASSADAVRVVERLVESHPIANVGVAVTRSGEWSAFRFRPGREGVERLDRLDSLRYVPPTQQQPYCSPGTLVRSAVPQRQLTAEVEHLLFELHSDLRDVDGMHPDAALDELCKLLFAKTFDERHDSPRLQVHGTLCEEEVAAVARSLYEEARLLLGTEGDRGMRGAFAAPFLCSAHALAQLVARISGFHLTSSSLDIKARAFQNVIGPAARAGMGQFFTPAEVIRFMVRVAAPRPGEVVADPFAGSAHFLTEAARSCTRGVSAIGIEKSERMARIAYTDTLLSGAHGIRLICGDSLAPFSTLDSLAYQSVDLVLTNPPFGSLLRSGALVHLGPFTISEGRTSAPLEVLGLERCVQLLRPGGRLGIVLPDGIFANPGSKYVRDWLAREVVIRAIVSLPVSTFAPYGANVKTSILFARKRIPGENMSGAETVLMGSAHHVGYDASGRLISNNDLDDIASDALVFFSKEGW